MFGLISFFLQVTVPVVIFVHKLPGRPRFAVRAAICAVGSFLIFWAEQLLIRIVPAGGPFLIHLSTISLIGLSMLSVRLCFDCSPKIAILYGSCGYALQNCVYYLKRIIMMLFSISHERYDDAMAVIVFSTVYAGVFCVYHWMVKSRRTGDIQNSLAIIFPVGVIAINIFMSSYIPWSDDTMLYCLYAFLLSLCLVILLLGAFNLSATKVEKQLLEQMIEVERKQHEVYEGTIDMINLKCHDIKQEIGVLLRSENMDLKNEEVEKIESLINIYGVFLKTGNPTLDVVLSEKNIICGKSRILFTCMANGGLLNFMETTDICVLFGNAIDNAIESVMKIPDQEDRFINMSIVLRGAFVSIHMENS